MEATMAYQAGKSIVSDEEYDNLKRELRIKNSMVTAQVWIWAHLARCCVNGLTQRNTFINPELCCDAMFAHLRMVLACGI